MKKVLLVLLLILVVVSFTTADDVRDLNGYNWEKWTTIEKVTYVQGFFSGLESYRQLFEKIVDTNSEESETFEMAKMLYSWGYYGVAVNDIIKMIDRYYYADEWMQYPIHEVIMVSFDKDWWND
jgi:hypothetical protein